MQLVLLEDDIELGVKLSMELEAEGYDVHRHTSASQALQFISENHVDLIITDLLIKIDGVLVQDGGITLISRLHQVQNHPAPIIAVSSMFQATLGAVEAVTTAKTVGADATLAKPFKTYELLRLVQYFLPAEESRNY